MFSKTATVTMDQRFVFNTGDGRYDAIVVSKGDVLKVTHHGIFSREEYIEIPDNQHANRILLDSALRDGWVKVNN